MTASAGSTSPGTGRARLPDDATVVVPPASGRRRLLLTGARITVTVMLVAAVGYALVTQWADVESTIRSIKPQSLVMALGAALLGLGANVMAGRDVLRGLGQQVRTVDAGRCFLVGQLGKYLPGSVWAFVLQMELAKPGRRTARGGIHQRAGHGGHRDHHVGAGGGPARAAGVVRGRRLVPRSRDWAGARSRCVRVAAGAVAAASSWRSRCCAGAPVPRPARWCTTPAGRSYRCSVTAGSLFGIQLGVLGGGVDRARHRPAGSRSIGAFALAMCAGVLVAVVSRRGSASARR